MFRSIRWRIAFSYVLLIVGAMLALAVYVSGVARHGYLDDLRTQLSGQARLIGETMAGELAGGATADAINALAERYAGLLGARVTVIAPNGIVLGDSHEDRERMDNHLYRPEVQQALSLTEGYSIRFSATMGYHMMYVAHKLDSGGQALGVVRVALPLRQIDQQVWRLRLTILGAAGAMAAAAAALAVLLAARTAQPVGLLTDVVSRMAQGDLNARLLPTTRDEVGRLANAFNLMADRLSEMVNELRGERGRLLAVLEHMADGVLITDSRGRVSLINPAATRLLGSGGNSVLGSSFAEVARQHRLIELWKECREEGREQLEVIELDRGGQLVQAIVTPLEVTDAVGPGRTPEAASPAGAGRSSGGQACLLILQDLTELRKLQRTRQDFMSNISHELRTPLASLKALVETLRDGALQDETAAERFLERIEVEIDAMTQMVQELLELSRIESGQVPFRLEPVSVADIVPAAVERLLPQAERAGLQVMVDVPQELPLVLADASRVQQVVGNLVHNAIKFTPQNGKIEVVAEAGPDEVTIRVRDTGIGIPREALPRIFERFFKADRARSGGGTGLGLAIAKHIVQGHGGRIWAESVEGQGSTFCFTLPRLEKS